MTGFVENLNKKSENFRNEKFVLSMQFLSLHLFNLKNNKINLNLLLCRNVLAKLLNLFFLEIKRKKKDCCRCI